MKRRLVIGTGVVLGCILVHPAAWAQEADGHAFPPQIRVTGDASIKASPDRATLDVGVVTEATTAQAAAAQNARRVEAVIAALRAVLSSAPGVSAPAGSGGASTAGPSTSSETQITTINYSLDPVYNRPKPGGNPVIVRYSAANVVRVTTDELALVGRLIDGAMEAGANRIDRLAFTLQDEQPLMTKALQQAAARAKAKAEAIAAALGVKIIRVLQVEENGPAVRPVETMLRLAPAAESVTPVEPGTVDVNTTVTLTVEVGN
jgi:uncharacterized protein YggE